MPAGPAALDGRESDESTRERVARSILEHGPSTAVALAERLGLTPAAIRRHLDVLVERGHLVAREQRTYGARGRGRPAKVFALTDAGRNGFYAAYDDLAVQLLEFLSAQSGDEAVEKFAASRVAAMESRYAPLLSDVPEGSSSAQVLADALTGDGFVASIRPSVAGEQLCQHHCPVAHVAERFPQLCEAETEAFARLIGGPVQRLATIAHGDGVCTTHIPHVSTNPQRRSDPLAAGTEQTSERP
ncbi:helix-turn-helix transcriptional regulator [Microlunatus aurantiacus]|uniref:helix-turn-helix transcriptional regulator n=1 Tax=Microlunatus aurantiacus TaxID=446786 RepID=UPI003CD0B223